MNNKERYAFVRFKETDFNYIYKCNGVTCKKGNIVLVPTGTNSVKTIGLVTKTQKLRQSELPYPYEKIKSILQIEKLKDKSFINKPNYKFKRFKEFDKFWKDIPKQKSHDKTDKIIDIKMYVNKKQFERIAEHANKNWPFVTAKYFAMDSIKSINNSEFEVARITMKNFGLIDFGIYGFTCGNTYASSKKQALYKFYTIKYTITDYLLNDLNDEDIFELVYSSI